MRVKIRVPLDNGNGDSKVVRREVRDVKGKEPKRKGVAFFRGVHYKAAEGDPWTCGDPCEAPAEAPKRKTAKARKSAPKSVSKAARRASKPAAEEAPAAAAEGD